MKHRIIVIDDYNIKNTGLKADGASTKTENVFRYLEKKYKNNSCDVKRIFLKSWKKRPISNLLSLLFGIKKYDIVIILPNDARLNLYSKVFHHKLKTNHFLYMVVGGWLSDFLPQKRKALAFCERIDGIYPETREMVDNLNNMGLSNAFYSPVFSLQSQPTKEDKYVFNPQKVDVCTFSRIDEEKGIFDAIEAVKKANSILEKNIFKLNIYGKINNPTKEKIDYYLNKFKNNADCCNYYGPVDSEKLISTLNSNFLLLFPTFFWGEGFPATLLEGYCACLPVLASDWKYNKELVEIGKTGFLFKTRDVDELANLLICCLNNSEKIVNMRQNCLNYAKKFNPDYCMKNVCDKIDNILRNH